MESTKTAQKAKDALNGIKQTPKTLTHFKSDNINQLLNMYKAQISQVIPKHVSAERVIQLCTTVIARNPKIKDCDIASIVGSVMYASILGLDVTPQFGQFFFIPRKNNKSGKMECVPLIGYKGYLQLMRRTGEVSTAYAHVVRENDYFEFELGLEPKLVHRPAESNRGEMRYAYAVIKFKDGGFIFEVLTRADVMKAKNRSQAKDSDFSPWNTEDEESMWRKSAINKLKNYAPMSAEFVTASLIEGVTIKPDMFNHDKKELDPMKIETEFEEVGSEPEPKKKRSKKQDSSALDAPEDTFLIEITKVKNEIIRISSEQKFIDELGSLGFENLEQVPRENQSDVLKSLYVVAKELAKSQSMELDL